MARPTLVLAELRVAKLAFLVVALVYAIAHGVAAFTEAVNWDEFVLLSRADVAARTGVLRGGGRPGLGVALLVPFVDGCDSTMTLVRTLRVVWCGFTFALLAGIFVFLWKALPKSPTAWRSAALGVALIACVPVFLRWSLQVRTDQPAVAAAVWGGVALLASRTRPWLAAVAGVLFGLGYLFSQKALYPTALVLVVSTVHQVADRDLAWRRAAKRALALVAGGALALASFALLIPLWFSPPVAVSVERGLDLFAWYRVMLKFRLYDSMVSSLLPHLLILAFVLLALPRAARRAAGPRSLAIAVFVAVLGTIVARFHAAAFPYFWITLGVFPAVALAFAWEATREVMPAGRTVVAVLAWSGLAAVAVVHRVETLRDTQSIQRETFAFVERNLDAAELGFHADGGLVCRRHPQPLPVFLGQNIASRFGGPEGQANISAFIDEFRARPITYLIQPTRVFPPQIVEFWESHYLPYAHAVMLPGRALEGAPGEAHEIDIIVPGRYRWLSNVDADGASPARLAIAGRVMTHGETVLLERSGHTARLVGPRLGGKLVLAVDDAMVESSAPFYPAITNLELAGRRQTWW